MRRNVLLLSLVAGVAVATASLAPGSPGPAMRTVAVLSHAPVSERAFDGLRQGLAELGWREDETIRFLKPTPQPDTELLRAQTRSMVNRGTALVVAMSTPAALAAREVAAARDVPLLLAPASDPVAAGLVSGTIHPGEPVTGIAFAMQEPRRLEMLKRLSPKVRRVWVPYDSTDPSPVATLPRLRAAADKLGLVLVTADIRSAAQLHAALDPLPRDIDAIFVPADAMLATNTRAIAAAATSRGLPLSVPHREGVALGALFSYGFDLYTVGRQAARLADQILSGTPAADLPIETADMDLTINLAVADHLGLNIPEELLRHATIVGQAGE